MKIWVLPTFVKWNQNIGEEKQMLLPDWHDIATNYRLVDLENFTHTIRPLIIAI